MAGRPAPTAVAREAAARPRSRRGAVGAQCLAGEFLGDGHGLARAGSVHALAEHRVEPGEEEPGSEVEIGHAELTAVAPVLKEPAQQRTEGLQQRSLGGPGCCEQGVVQLLVLTEGPCRPSAGKPWLVALAMVFGLFMPMLDHLVVNVALPTIQHQLGAGISGLQWIVDAYTLTLAALMLTGGTRPRRR